MFITNREIFLLFHVLGFLFRKDRLQLTGRSLSHKKQFQIVDCDLELYIWND